MRINIIQVSKIMKRNNHDSSIVYIHFFPGRHGASSFSRKKKKRKSSGCLFGLPGQPE